GDLLGGRSADAGRVTVRWGGQMGCVWETFPTVIARRQLLQLPAVVLVGSVAGCRRSHSARARPVISSEEALLTRVSAAESRLLAAYDATLARYATLRPALAPLRAHHAAHLAVVNGRRRSPTPAWSGPAGSLETGAQPPRVPRSANLAVQSLIATERAAARDRTNDCLAAESALAGLLVSIGASEAAHAAALPALARSAVRR
ncbi:MAG: hypothetical protein ABJC62_07185, partial [Frankiaceae bacterium]